MRSILVVMVAALLICASTTQAEAKAWTPEKGSGYAKLWTRGLFGSQAFLADGEVAPAEAYRDLALRYYVEAGLTDDWTIVSYGAPAGWASYADDEQFYVGELTAGVRRGLLDGPLQLAVEARYGYAPPIGDDNLAASDSGVVYVPTVSTHLVEGELQAGYGFDWGWTSASFGARWNSADTLDTALVGFAQVGTTFMESFSVDLHTSLYLPLGDVEVTNISGAGQTRYLGLGVGFSWWATDAVGIALGADGAVFAASNAATPSFTAGVEAKF